MFLVITTFITTFVALCKGFMVLVGVMLGTAAFLFLLFVMLVAGVNALIEAWLGNRTSARG